MSKVLFIFVAIALVCSYIGAKKKTLRWRAR